VLVSACFQKSLCIPSSHFEVQIWGLGYNLEFHFFSELAKWAGKIENRVLPGHLLGLYHGSETYRRRRTTNL
jgi:hypothetical protein